MIRASTWNERSKIGLPRRGGNPCWNSVDTGRPVSKQGREDPLVTLDLSLMETASLGLALTPLGSVLLVQEPDAPALDAEVARRLRPAFDRGSGHGLLQLGAAETGILLPPVFAYWREFGARYVTALCTQPEIEDRRGELGVPCPSEEELDGMVREAPLMSGAEYLSTSVLAALWQELDSAI